MSDEKHEAPDWRAEMGMTHRVCPWCGHLGSQVTVRTAVCGTCRRWFDIAPSMEREESVCCNEPSSGTEMSYHDLCIEVGKLRGQLQLAGQNRETARALIELQKSRIAELEGRLASCEVVRKQVRRSKIRLVTESLLGDTLHDLTSVQESRIEELEEALRHICGAHARYVDHPSGDSLENLRDRIDEGRTVLP